jgi:D-alanine transaminase
MSEIVAYVNGSFHAIDKANISVFDRGFLFGDAVYEVAAVLDGKLVDNPAHLARLDRSLKALELPRPATDEEIVAIQKQLVAQNRLQEGMVYCQLTRGAPSEREFGWPDPATTSPGFVMFTQEKNILNAPLAERGMKVGLYEDLRWRRRDIKTVNLLPASWVKEQAKRAGYDDAWMVQDGTITEGSSNNAFIIDAQGTLRTRGLGHEILPGITRRVVLKLAEESGLRIDERAFRIDEAKAAREAFITSASVFVMPVVAIDAVQISDGAPGPITRRLRALYIDEARASAV